MGLWDKIRGKTSGSDKNEQEVFPWMPIGQDMELETILATSLNRPQIIFKHSRSCGISHMILRRFEQAAGDLTGGFDFYKVVVQDQRQLSNEIASRFRVRHESPQLLIVKNGVLAIHASHWQIDAVPLEAHE